MISNGLARFCHDFHQEILAKTGVTGGDDGGTSQQQLLRAEMFTEAVLELLDDHDEVDDWVLCSYESKSIGASPAAKISGWALSGDGATLDLFVTLYFGLGTVQEIGKPETRRQFELGLGFLKRALGGFHKRMEEASDAFHAAQSIFDARGSIATARIFLLTDGVARTLDIDQESVPGIEVRYVAWDVEKLSNLRVGERGAIELDLEHEYGGGIPCIEAPGNCGEYRTFLAFLPGALLARIYGEHGQRLLERNVRAFLQTKGKVNSGLQQTLRDEPHRFLAYNNGLCCTAAEVRVGSSHGASKLLCVNDFQIVNGGQTTASIFHAAKKDGRSLDDVIVQMKLTVISDPDQVAEYVPLISRYANSQNKVNGADFSANGTFHRRLEEMSRTVWARAASGMERGSHWYYERARGSYLDDKARQKTSQEKQWVSQNPPKQKFTKTDLAKCEHAWLGLPHMVCRGAEKNFMAFASRLEDDGEPLVDQTFFENVVARTILWRSTEQVFDDLKLAGYRANTVAYSVAWLAEKSGRRLDLAKIWKTQALQPEITTALEAICQKAHTFLTNQPGNVGEASKKPDTWNSFKNTAIGIGQKWQKELSQSVADPYLPSKPVVGADEAKNEIVDIPGDYWFSLSKWAKERGFLEGWERSLAFSLGKLASNNKPISDKQAIQGARIVKRAKELGFSSDSS